MKLNDKVLINSDDGVIEGKVLGLSAPLASDWCLCYEIQTTIGRFSVMEDECFDYIWIEELINI